jgi:hypothetical protein
VQNAQDISDLVEKELRRIPDGRLVNRIRELIVSPYPVERAWDYEPGGQRFVCWTVLEHHPSKTGIAYCSEGFGPAYPWGLIFLSGECMSIGMDCGWYASLEDAVRESMAWDGSNPEDYEVA